jgi:rSAM/selenodomain-associated transferase 2
MSAPVSVIIPTLNAADRLGPTLGAIAEALFEGLIREVILTDGGSNDAIAEVAEASGARLITSPAGRGSQLIAGAVAARGDWFLFLHADTVLQEGWIEAMRSHVSLGPGNAGYFRLRFNSAHPLARLFETWANLRSRMAGLPYGDQGLLIHRALYTRVGGYPAIPLMEDVALARRLSGKLRGLDAVALTSAERYEADGWLTRGWRNLTTLMLYLMGRPPEELAKRYAR